MQFLNNFDIITIVAYVVVLILIGVALSRVASGGLEDYFLGGRRLPWYLLGCSGMANWFDLTGTMLITSFLYLLGPQGLYVEFRGGAVLILVGLLCFTAKWHRRSGVLTGAEWMQFRFGKGKDADAARLLTAIVSILPVLGMIAYLIRGTGMFLAMYFPFTPMQCAVVFVMVALVYTTLAGFYGVVVADLIQSALIIAGAATMAVMAFNLIPNAVELDQVAARVTGNPNWSDSHPTPIVQLPEGSEYDVFRFLFIAMGFYMAQQFITTLASGADPKYFASRNDKECGLLNLLISWLIMIRWPMMIGLAVLGIYLIDKTFTGPQEAVQTAEMIKQYYPEITKSGWHELTARILTQPAQVDPRLMESLRGILGENLPSKLPLVGYEGIIDPERILPAVIIDLVPIGMRGFILVTLLAASMSTFASTINAAGSFVVKDIYQRWFRPAAGDRELVAMSWTTTVGIAITGVFLSIVFKSINDIWDWIIMSVTTGLFVPGFLRLYWWRMNGWGVAYGMAAGGVAAIAQRLIYPEAAPWWKFVIVGVAAFTATIWGCLATKPTDMNTLAYFYKKTRPWGFWGPVRKFLNTEQLAYIDGENKRDIWAMPFAFFYQVTLFLVPMQIIVHRFDSLSWSLPIFGVSCVGLYLIWFRNLRPDRKMEEEPDSRTQETSSANV